MGLTGGDKLREKLKSISEKARDTRLKIGILEGATNSEGESIAAYATDNEFGGSAPPRPFMRTTSKKHGKDWAKQVGHLIEGLDYDFESALQIVGDIASKDMQEVTQTWPKSPPNSPKTIAIKKEGGYNPYDQPLIHTGDMVRAISFEVTTDGS